LPIFCKYWIINLYCFFRICFSRASKYSLDQILINYKPTNLAIYVGRYGNGRIRSTSVMFYKWYKNNKIFLSRMLMALHFKSIMMKKSIFFLFFFNIVSWKKNWMLHIEQKKERKKRTSWTTPILL
jgi:hypothetical protein